MSLRISLPLAVLVLSACNKESAPEPPPAAVPRTEKESALDRIGATPANDADTHFNRGVKFLAAGEAGAGIEAYARAVSDFEKALELDPKLVGAYTNIAMARVRMGSPELAIAPLTAAIKLDPQDTSLLALRGGSYARAGQDTLAVADYTAALERSPLPVWRFNRGNAYARLREVEKAIADFNAVLESNEANEKLKTNARSALEALGK